MNLINPSFPRSISRRAFTLIELMIAIGVGIILCTGVVLLLFQASKQQQLGLSASTVEEKAYILESEITSCLRSASINNGMTPIYPTAVDYPNTTTVMGYTSIRIFFPTATNWIQGTITFNSANGQVLFTPNVLAPNNTVLWMTNGANILLTNLVFNYSQNLDSTENNSLITVQFQMNDNGYANQNPTNNLASISRNFSVQMRNDY